MIHKLTVSTNKEDFNTRAIQSFRKYAAAIIKADLENTNMRKRKRDEEVTLTPTVETIVNDICKHFVEQAWYKDLAERFCNCKRQEKYLLLSGFDAGCEKRIENFVTSFNKGDSRSRLVTHRNVRLVLLNWRFLMLSDLQFEFFIIVTKVYRLFVQDLEKIKLRSHQEASNSSAISKTLKDVVDILIYLYGPEQKHIDFIMGQPVFRGRRFDYLSNAHEGIGELAQKIRKASGKWFEMRYENLYKNLRSLPDDYGCNHEYEPWTTACDQAHNMMHPKPSKIPQQPHYDSADEDLWDGADEESWNGPDEESWEDSDDEEMWVHGLRYKYDCEYPKHLEKFIAITKSSKTGHENDGKYDFRAQISAIFPDKHNMKASLRCFDETHQLDGIVNKDNQAELLEFVKQYERESKNEKIVGFKTPKTLNDGLANMHISK